MSERNRPRMRGRKKRMSALWREVLSLPPGAWQVALREDSRFHDFDVLFDLLVEGHELHWKDPDLAERLAEAVLELVDHLAATASWKDLERQVGDLMRVVAWCECAEARRHRAELAGAEQALFEAERLGRGLPGFVGEAVYLNTLGRLRIDQGRPREAVELLTTAADLCGHSLTSAIPGTLWDLGELQYRLGHFDEAAAVFGRIVDTAGVVPSKGNLLRVGFLCAASHLERGRWEIGGEIFDRLLPRLVREKPLDRPEVYWAAARAAALRGDQEEMVELIRLGSAAALLGCGVWGAGRTMLDLTALFGLPDQRPIAEMTARLLLDWYQGRPGKEEVDAILDVALGALAAGGDLLQILTRATLDLRAARRDLGWVELESAVEVADRVH